jgi:hypothetical protein
MKPRILCGICKPVQRSVTTDSTLLMSRSKRFESARRLSQSSLNKQKTRNEETFGQLPVAPLHHLYITEAGVEVIHRLLPCNALRND